MGLTRNFEADLLWLAGNAKTLEISRDFRLGDLKGCCLPSYRNTLDQSRENLDVPKCFGLSGVKNFLKTPWFNRDVAEAQTGFEPLFFHIQAEFQ